jgi:hypothetical protein
MDLTDRYCSTRRDLEEHGRILIKRLSRVTARLLQPAVVDPNAFNATNAERSDVVHEIAETNRLLSKHRERHGC